MQRGNTHMRKNIFIEGIIVRAIPPMFNMWPCNFKLDEKKIKTCQFGSTKWFWPNIFTQFAWVNKRHNKA